MFVAEYLARLQILAIRWQPRYLLLSADNLRAEISTNCISSSSTPSPSTMLTLTIAESSSAPLQSISVDCRGWHVDLDSMQLSQVGSKTISIRFKCFERNCGKIRPPDPVFVMRPLSAPDIKGLQSIECAECSQLLLLATKDNVKRCVDLPSENWEEFFDCWMCHPDEEQHDRMYNVDLSGRRGLVMSGSTYLLLHNSQMMPGSYKLGLNDCVSSSSWSPLECSKCQSRIGRQRLQCRQNGTRFSSFNY